MTVKSPCRLHPCRPVTESRRYLIAGASAALPLHSSLIFSLNNRASTIIKVAVAWPRREEEHVRSDH